MYRLRTIAAVTLTALVALVTAVVGQARTGGGGPSKNGTSATAYADFEDTCIAAVTGYTPGEKPAAVFGHVEGKCADRQKALLISVTHENERNNHQDAANFNPDTDSYMADFDYGADFGNWLDVRLREEPRPPVVSVSLDTINFNKVNVTGWPLRYGHLFLGLNDTSVSASLNQKIVVEFDMRLRVSEERRARDAGYSGRRVLLGSAIEWTEAAPRANRSHYLEIDLAQSEGYSQSYGDPERPACGDVIYDRCFYDPTGKYAEGRELRYQTYLHGEPVKPDTGAWTRVVLPLSDVVRQLGWVSPPGDWSAASLRGIYFGIESAGGTRTIIEIRRYRVVTLT